MFVFVFKDSNNNNIEVTAPSKTAARKMVERVGMTGSIFRYDSHRKETEGEWLARMNRNKQREADARAERASKPKILRRRKAFGRNDRCPCGAVRSDGRPKKVKYCCGKRS